MKTEKKLLFLRLPVELIEKIKLAAAADSRSVTGWCWVTLARAIFKTELHNRLKLSSEKEQKQINLKKT